MLAVRIDDHKSAAKLLCPPQVGSKEDESAATVNSKARLSCRRKNDWHHTRQICRFLYVVATKTKEGRHNHGTYELDTHCDAKG